MSSARKIIRREVIRFSRNSASDDLRDQNPVTVKQLNFGDLFKVYQEHLPQTLELFKHAYKLCEPTRDGSAETAQQDNGSDDENSELDGDMSENDDTETYNDNENSAVDNTPVSESLSGDDRGKDGVEKPYTFTREYQNRLFNTRIATAALITKLLGLLNTTLPAYKHYVFSRLIAPQTNNALISDLAQLGDSLHPLYKRRMLSEPERYFKRCAGNADLEAQQRDLMEHVRQNLPRSKERKKETSEHASLSKLHQSAKHESHCQRSASRLGGSVYDSEDKVTLRRRSADIPTPNGKPGQVGEIKTKKRRTGKMSKEDELYYNMVIYDPKVKIPNTRTAYKSPNTQTAHNRKLPARTKITCDANTGPNMDADMIDAVDILKSLCRDKHDDSNSMVEARIGVTSKVDKNTSDMAPKVIDLLQYEHDELTEHMTDENEEEESYEDEEEGMEDDEEEYDMSDDADPHTDTAYRSTANQNVINSDPDYVLSEESDTEMII